MPLEDLVGPNKYLDALNRNWPLDSDTASEGNDHISGHKNVVLNTFPGPNGNGLEEAVHVERSALFVDNGNGSDRQGALEMAVGSTAQRPADGSLVKGDTRWNVTTNRLETWDGSAWIELHAMAALTSMFRAKQNFEADVAGLAHVSDDEAVAFTRQLGTILDATSGSEEGALIFEAITSGALAEALRVIGAGASSKQYHRRLGTTDRKIEDWVLINEFTPQLNDANIDIDWDNNDGWREIKVEIPEVQPVADNQYSRLRVKQGGVPVTGNAYWFAFGGYATNAVAIARAQRSLSYIEFVSNPIPAYTNVRPQHYTLHLKEPGRDRICRVIQADFIYSSAADELAMDGHCGYLSSGAVNGMQFFFNSSNIGHCGPVRVLGLL